MKVNISHLFVVSTVKTILVSGNMLVMQNFRNVCSFCNSHIAEGQSICKDCMNLYHIKIGNHESDGCGCDK
jgi:hypothetical protein